jgi:chromosome segregation ATPase
LSPISRVVELLQGLETKINEDGKIEAGLYKKFVCWGTTTIDTKTASNELATSRIDELGRYIADIEAGRVEFTTERVDLEKELGQIRSDIEQATALREQEKKDFEEAKAEMEQGIAALESAIQVLTDATGGELLQKAGKDAGLLRMKAKLKTNLGFASRVSMAASLNHAVELGDRVLSRGDARFLKHLLTGDVSDIKQPKDWKKLNRKATFKLPYKARSGKISGELTKLLETFTANLEDATKREEEAQEIFDTLMTSKKEQKKASETALTKMKSEGGAAGLTKEESKEELKDLETQVKNDKKYIKETQEALDEKKEQYKKRVALRTGEVAAISKAVSILHSDDARDTFKSSLASQGSSFVQLGMKKSRSLSAVFALRRAAATAKDQRLVALATRLAATTTGNFDEVIKAIDELVTKLEEENTKDEEIKKECEEDRTKDTKEAQEKSGKADELTDEKAKLEEEIKEIDAEIKEKESEIKGIEEDLAKAERIREDEAAAYAAAKQDDENAVELVTNAREVLQSFYKDNGLSLSQTAHAQQVHHKEPSAAGEAPPPPPATFEGDYGGKKDESTGILEMLSTIKEDIKDDIAKADTAEDDAKSAYKTAKKDMETSISDLEGMIGDLETTKGQKEDDIQTAITDRETTMEELDAVMKKMKDAQAGCDFVLVNFDVRKENRKIETEGLETAKGILEKSEEGGALVQSSVARRFATRKQ